MRLFLVAALLTAVSLTTGCPKVGQFNRFFLSRCAEDGPTREEGFDISLQLIEVADYSERLREAAGGLSLRVVAEVTHRDESWPIYYASQPAVDGGRRLLIIAGIHGNEVAASLAAPDILSDIRTHPEIYGNLEVHLIAPANPAGLAHSSRYNGQGCDINRDFSAFETVEARVVRDVINGTSPDLILTLHEGPNDGFLVISTKSTPPAFASAVTATLASNGIPLATRSHLGTRLSVPGVMKEGWFITGAKHLLRIRSLGAFAHRNSIPLLTTEGSWSETDMEVRVRAQVLAVRAAARELTTGTSD